jgi:hypothetical protein
MHVQEPPHFLLGELEARQSLRQRLLRAGSLAAQQAALRVPGATPASAAMSFIEVWWYPCFSKAR